MKQMVMMILNNPDYGMALLEAWEAAGAPGITMLESTGLIHMRQAGAREDLPLLPSLFEVLRGGEKHHRTIFTVVDDEAQAQAVIRATEETFRQFDATDYDESGVLFVLPVTEMHRFATARASQRTRGS